MKSKSISRLEEKMQVLDPGTFRYQVLASAKDFKSSWIQLGQYLCSVYQDKRYKEWGYLTFEAYCGKEVGIRQATAVKLLKSYAFLEREEPSFLKEASNEDFRPTQIPSYEAVNTLRLAKDNQSVSKSDYASIREDVLEKAKEGKEVREKLRYVLKNIDDSRGTARRAPTDNDKAALAKRLVGGLSRAKADLIKLAFPKKVISQIDDLIEILSGYKT